MLHTRKSFTVPVSEGDGSFCREKGHAAPDRRGRCLSCGAKIVAHAALEGGPLDGEIVLSSRLKRHGPDGGYELVVGDPTNHVQYFFHALGDPADDPRRFTYRGSQQNKRYALRTGGIEPATSEQLRDKANTISQSPDLTPSSRS